MEIAALLSWLEASTLATSIRESLFLFPLLEAFHVIGLALVLGTIVVIDLRLLGLASTGRPFGRIAADILKWTWGAFALTALTGALMFLTNASVYFHNFYFRMKMVLLILAALNMLSFELTLGRTVDRWDRGTAAPLKGRVAAVLSIVIWIGVIFAGRLIGFTTSRAKVAAPAPADVNLDDLFQGTPAVPPRSK
jgi:hypothetical protein